jgi:ribosome-binding factor A
MIQRTNKPYERTQRASRLLVEILAEEVERLRDCDDAFDNLTITGAEISKDFKTAKVYFDSLKQEQLEALESKKGYLQRVVSKQVHWKYTPMLTFLDDPAVKSSIAIENALNRIKKQSGVSSNR